MPYLTMSKNSSQNSTNGLHPKFNQFFLIHG